MQLDMTISDVTATTGVSTNNQLMFLMQPCTLCDHLHYTFTVYSLQLYSSHLRIIGWVGQQNKTKINKRKKKLT